MPLAPTRLTPQTVAVLRALLRAPDTGRFGREIGVETGLPGGTLLPILRRLEAAGWVTSRWEDPEVAVALHRPRRRYYRLAGDHVDDIARQVV